MSDVMSMMRAASGNVTDVDPLIDVLYTLLRDHIHPGDFEKVVLEACLHAEEVKQYSNGWLAQYVRFTVQRLQHARDLSAEAVKQRATPEEMLSK